MAELKQQTLIEVKKDERIYSLSLSNDSPIGEVFDAINEIRGFVIERIKSVQEQTSPAEEKSQQK